MPKVGRYYLTEKGEKLLPLVEAEFNREVEAHISLQGSGLYSADMLSIEAYSNTLGYRVDVLEYLSRMGHIDIPPGTGMDLKEPDGHFKSGMYENIFPELEKSGFIRHESLK